jgi:hypothetical protein
VEVLVYVFMRRIAKKRILIRKKAGETLGFAAPRAGLPRPVRSWNLPAPTPRFY